MKNFKFTYNFIILLSIIAFTLSFGYRLYLGDMVSTMGDKYSQMVLEINQVRRQNDNLKLELSKMTSSSEIYSRALNAGYIRADIDFISTPPLALR